MPECPKCGSVYMEPTSECPVCSSCLVDHRPASSGARTCRDARLELLPQMLCVLVELPLTLLATVAFIVAAAVLTLGIPGLFLLTVPLTVVFPAAFLFALSCRCHVRFTTLGLSLGWLVAGALAVLLCWAARQTSHQTMGWPCAAILLFLFPSIGAVSSLCGMSYRTSRHWRYVAITGAWLALMAYVYTLYDWYYVYCGRL